MTAPDPHADLFRFRLWQMVRWANNPETCYLVSWRRWTERPVLGTIVEYYLRPRREAHLLLTGLWVSEDDLEPWEETP